MYVLGSELGAEDTVLSNRSLALREFVVQWERQKLVKVWEVLYEKAQQGKQLV